MFRFALALIAGLLFVSSVEASAPMIAGHWQGALQRGEAATQIRLHIDASGAATLDLPDLVYAWEPVPTSHEGGRLIVQLPFGIGPMPLEREGDRLTASRGSISMVLTRTQPPPFTRIRTMLAVDGAALPLEIFSPVSHAGLRPAIIIAAGSGTADGRMSWQTVSWCDRFVRQGFHCLAYPRRPDRDGRGGVSNLRQDAADLASVIAFLKARPGVDADRLGVFARSRGAWIAAEAATLTPDIRFMMLSGAAATTPADQEIISLVERMSREGRSAAEIADAVAYERLYFYTAHTGRDWPAMEAMARLAETRPWGEFVDQPLEPDDLKWWGANGAYDPRSAYRALRMPVFATWGGNDLVVPPEVHMPLLRELMRDNRVARFEVFPGGDHRGERPPGNGPDGTWRWFGMATGLLEAMDSWLMENGLVAGDDG